MTAVNESRTAVNAGIGRSVEIPLDGFAWAAVDEEAARVGVTSEELITLSVLYYLADLDSGRTARQSARSPHPRPLDRCQSLNDRRSQPADVERPRSPAPLRDLSARL
jgi:hypothetical protein